MQMARIAARPSAVALVVTTVLCLPAAASAQSGATQPLTVLEVIELAQKNYPSVRAVQARANAAREGIGVAKTAYVPRLDLLYQLNHATHNNVFGLLLPQSVVPPISGPVLGTTSDGVWGTAAGVLL